MKLEWSVDKSRDSICAFNEFVHYSIEPKFKDDFSIFYLIVVTSSKMKINKYMAKSLEEAQRGCQTLEDSRQ